MKRPKFKIPHVFVLLTGVILVCCLLTYIVPSGSYDRERRLVEGKERTLLVPGTYKPIEKHISVRSVILGEEVEGKATPVGLHGFLTAIPRGMEAAADIIFFIFMIGGVFGILQRTGEITDEGVECLAMRDTDGFLYTLIGSTEGLEPGQATVIEGRYVEASTCMQGTTIEVVRVLPPTSGS